MGFVKTYLLAANDDGNIDGALATKLLQSCGQTSTLGRALGVSML